MSKLKKIKVTEGIYWVEVPEAQLYILCGCPEDSIKHLMKRGLIVTQEKNGVNFETGPNVILLSDIAVQNGHFSNLSEFCGPQAGRRHSIPEMAGKHERRCPYETFPYQPRQANPRTRQI